MGGSPWVVPRGNLATYPQFRACFDPDSWGIRSSRGLRPGPYRSRTRQNPRSEAISARPAQHRPQHHSAQTLHNHRSETISSLAPRVCTRVPPPLLAGSDQGLPQISPAQGLLTTRTVYLGNRYLSRRGARLPASKPAGPTSEVLRCHHTPCTQVPQRTRLPPFGSATKSWSNSFRCCLLRSQVRQFRQPCLILVFSGVNS